jgi:hypothetical protein
MLLIVASAPALGAERLLPPKAKFRGKTLEEWAVLSGQWQVAEQYGDPTGLADNVQGVQFLPPTGGGGEFNYNVTLPSGTPFVHTSFGLYGEIYDDGSMDDPVRDRPIIDMIYETATVKTILDGRVVLEGVVADLVDRQFGPVFFDEPVTYNEPQPRGPGLNAIAAHFHMGVSGIFAPLPVGTHTLENTIESDFFGPTHSVFNIRVVPRGQIQAVPEPSSIALASIALIGLAAFVRRRASA